MTLRKMEARIVAATVICGPCKTDVLLTPIRPDQIGRKTSRSSAVVLESPDAAFPFRRHAGFKISGSAASPPNCRNSLHSQPHGGGILCAQGRWRSSGGVWGNSAG